MSSRGRILSLAAASALLLATAPAAMAAESGITGKISPNKGPVGTPLDLSIAFTITPAAGEQPTVAKAVLDFPNNAVHNGKLFPSCTAAQINAKRGRFTSCPKGSQVGKGSLRADVPNADVYNVPGRVTIFNGAGGKSLTVHIYATNPVLISEAFDAPLVKTSGRYGYRLTANVPDTLQEISDGWFAVLKRFNTTVGATRTVRGRKRGFIEAKRCPSGGRAPIGGSFSFRSGTGSPTSTTGFISCRP
ncbi:hypothetical protein [Conexibacter woesei]|nr:hypothetical protein [Conexibacter woesei]